MMIIMKGLTNIVTNQPQLSMQKQSHFMAHFAGIGFSLVLLVFKLSLLYNCHREKSRIVSCFTFQEYGLRYFRLFWKCFVAQCGEISTPSRLCRKMDYCTVVCQCTGRGVLVQQRLEESATLQCANKSNFILSSNQEPKCTPHPTCLSSLQYYLTDNAFLEYCIYISTRTIQFLVLYSYLVYPRMFVYYSF